MSSEKKRRGRQQVEPTVSRQFRIGRDVWRRIQVVAEDEMTEPASIVRKALRQWLDVYAKKVQAQEEVA